MSHTYLEGIKVVKVVTRYKGEAPCPKPHTTYRSCWTNRWTLYEFGIPTSRPEGGGPLACFKNLHDANWYLKRYKPHGKIWEAIPCTYTPSRARSLWYASKTHFKPNSAWNTVFANSITLIKE